MSQNPEGFILNSTRGRDTAYLVLHKSNCIHLIKDAIDDQAYTMRDYIKVGSNDAEDIANYCRKHKSKFTGSFHLCNSCNPEYINRENNYQDGTKVQRNYKEGTSKKEIIYPDEIEDRKNYIEGAKKEVTVNAYERNPKARRQCIKHFGWVCQCCGLDFEKFYGEIGKEFIHIHHKKLISEIGQNYDVDPINDMVPLCPNCHAMIHRGDPVFTVDEMREMIVKIK